MTDGWIMDQVQELLDAEEAARLADLNRCPTCDGYGYVDLCHVEYEPGEFCTMLAGHFERARSEHHGIFSVRDQEWPVIAPCPTCTPNTMGPPL